MSDISKKDGKSATANPDHICPYCGHNKVGNVSGDGIHWYCPYCHPELGMRHDSIPSPGYDDPLPDREYPDEDD